MLIYIYLNIKHLPSVLLTLPRDTAQGTTECKILYNRYSVLMFIFNLFDFFLYTYNLGLIAGKRVVSFPHFSYVC